MKGGAKKSSTTRTNRRYRLAVMTLLTVAVGISFFAYRVERARTGPGDNLFTWLWNGYQQSPGSDPVGLGWTSSNCLNDFDNDGLREYQCVTNENYGLSVEDGANNALDGNDDYVRGCAWSSDYGWVCFNGGAGSGYQCDSNEAPAACGNLSTNGVKINKFSTAAAGDFYYLDSPPFNGGYWDDLYSSSQRASIISLAEGDPTKSYIGFPFTTETGYLPGDLLVPLQGCFGCSDPESDGVAKCTACLSASTDAPDNVTNPNPNILCWGMTYCTMGQQGGSCSVNRDKNTCYLMDPDMQNFYTEGCTEFPGVIVNKVSSSQYELCGWGYNSYDNAGSGEGLGWIAFSPAQVGDTTYIDVPSGSITTQGNIYSPSGPPSGKFNAAYLIQASGDIVNWFSANAYTYPNSAVPSFPIKGTNQPGAYSNTLGKLDYDGLITDALSGAVQDGDNKYGSPIIYNIGNPFSVAMNNTVFYYPGNKTFTGGQFLSASGNNSGAGIIVVNGNLSITGDITYSGATVTTIRQMPSAVWIVRGDVTIDPAVRNVAGTFIIVGDGTPSTCPVLSDTNSNGCGRLNTGSGSNDAQLLFKGAILARQFNLQRRFSSGLCSLNSAITCTQDSDCSPSYGSCQLHQAAEKFAADGRLQANPPAGLSDFSKSVPRFFIGF